MGLYDYPQTDKHDAFNLALRVNFIDGSGGKTGIRLVGTEGEMDLDNNQITVRRKKLPKAPGYGGWDSYETFPDAVQKEFVKEYNKEYPNVRSEMQEPPEVVYAAPEAYANDGMRKDHFANWLDVIRNGGETIEGAVFGLRAAGPALASNTSHYEKRVVYWDPENMQEVSDEKAEVKGEKGSSGK